MAQPDTNEDHGLSMRYLCFVMTVLPTISIILRFWARAITATTTKFWWDDALAFCAWCCCICCCAFAFVATDLGLGKHRDAITPHSNVTTILKLLYVAEIVFDSGITFGKFSVLCFYMRVFTVQTRWFKRMFWFTVVLTTTFILYRLPAQILICIPPHKYWHPHTSGRCDNEFTNFGILLPGLLLDVITDLLILVMPVPILRGLQMQKNRKNLLVGVFFCGYLTWVASIGRMGAFIDIYPELRGPDFTWNQIPALSWALAEISVSVLSICIPSWFYLLKRTSERGVSSLFATTVNEKLPQRAVRGDSRDITRASGFTQAPASFSSDIDEPEYPRAIRHGHSVKVEGGLIYEADTLHEPRSLEMGVVNVRQDVSVISEISPHPDRRGSTRMNLEPSVV